MCVYTYIYIYNNSTHIYIYIYIYVSIIPLIIHNSNRYNDNISCHI